MLRNLRTVYNNISQWYKINIKKDALAIQMDRWFSCRGDHTLRLSYPLDNNSVVLDVGGYIGDFTAAIYCRYSCNVIVFEPVEEFFKLLSERFQGNTKIKPVMAGIGSSDTSAEIFLDNNSSTLHHQTGTRQQIQLINLTNWTKENNIESIDLLKMNVEGHEFEILENLIESDLISKIKYIQVQFHKFVENCDERRETIRNKLHKTHELQWDFPFVWESWKRKQKT